MNRLQLLILVLSLMIGACSSIDSGKTIADLRSVKIDIREETIEGGLDKAMESYQHFLEETENSALAPEAIRRLADLKVEKEYGYVSGGQSTAKRAAALTAPEPAPGPELSRSDVPVVPAEGESEAEFEKRTTLGPTATAATTPAADDLDRAGAREAVELYQRLLNEYPSYERNDQVLYQMSRAYEELGQIEASMEVMDRLVRDFPRSRYLDEVQFRRAEYFFVHRQYLDAEEAYGSIVAVGVGSSYFQLALFKLGWTFYKQELYEEALHQFIALLDYKVSVGYDFEQTEDEPERKRMEDTFRVISLSFSYLGGSEVVVDFFSRQGKRSYEDSIYSNLGEYYFSKRRYADAVAIYTAFMTRNPFHKKSPLFHMRVIEINIAGGFPSLVIEAKKSFATNYGLQAEYWQYFKPEDRPEVLTILKTNLTDLANHYHALYQEPKLKDQKTENFNEAQHWYREFLVSFPKDDDSPVINYQLADLLLENRSFGKAAVEYEKTAYDYPRHERSSKAGYAAIYAYRQHIETAKPTIEEPIRREIIRSSLRFAETFPEHEKAAIVLGATVDDLYQLKDFEQAVSVGHNLIETFPNAEQNVRRSAWLVIAHSSYELLHYSEAEAAYVKVLELLPEQDETRTALIDNLAASIYKQGEQASLQQDYRTAADHYLRVGVLAPTSKVRSAAEFDAATALIELKEWQKATEVLVGFRETYPGHELQPEITKKLAYVYRENQQIAPAAAEYERIEMESKDDEIRREALLVAAELYEQAELSEKVLEVYQRYVGYFPQPVELNLETRSKIVEILKSRKDRRPYLAELRKIVDIDAAAGSARTDRMRYLAGNAALVLAENTYEKFLAVKLVKPLEENMQKKKSMMKESIKRFNSLIEYEVGDVTAAATFYLAEIYAHFSKALMASERPELTFDEYTIQPGDNLSKIAKRTKCDIGRIVNANNLNKSNVIVAGKKLKIPRGLYPEELEQYELALEDQSYPFEEKAISVHESNLELISMGVYNEWINKSLQKLAKFVPARYAKPEQETAILASFETYSFEFAGPSPSSGKAAGGDAMTKVVETEPTAAEISQVAGETGKEPVPVAATVTARPSAPEGGNENRQAAANSKDGSIDGE